ATGRGDEAPRSRDSTARRKNSLRVSPLTMRARSMAVAMSSGRLMATLAVIPESYQGNNSGERTPRPTRRPSDTRPRRRARHGSPTRHRRARPVVLGEHWRMLAWSTVPVSHRPADEVPARAYSAEKVTGVLAVRLMLRWNTSLRP